LGGDEFGVLLGSLHGASDAKSVAQKILQTCSKPFRLDDHERHVTTSIGISLYPTDGQEEDALIKAADSAMYRAKQSGRNGFHFFNDAIRIKGHDS
jgi:diguanylate cyclase (GGDEF)-like protein